MQLARTRRKHTWEIVTFPAMVELFARRPDTHLLPEGAELAPIPVEEDVISLSAILLDDNYFDALRNMRRVIDDISLVDERVLIPFKARAFLDLAQRRANGEAVGAGVDGCGTDPGLDSRRQSFLRADAGPQGRTALPAGSGSAVRSRATRREGQGARQ